MTRDALIHRIDENIQELYQTGRRTVRPLYPWVATYILTRQQKTGAGLYLPEKHNKLVLEAFVLATWEPFTDGKGIYQESSLFPGDRVLFEHWVGVPLIDTDNPRWRLVKERDWDRAKDGGIFATVGYEDKGSGAEARVHAMLAEAFTSAYNGREYAKMFEEAMSEWLLVLDKSAHSITLSGV